MQMREGAARVELQCETYFCNAFKKNFKKSVE